MAMMQKPVKDRISGPTVMKGYLNNKDETDKVLKKHNDGKIWLHTADLGYMDHDGQVYITDRIKNIFMREGFNVYPSKIREFLLTLNGVKDCEVIGIDHPSQQCVPVAFIVLDQIQMLDIEKCRNYLFNMCYQNFDETYVPYDWVFTDELPRNIGGKVDCIRRPN